jgi:hypothetical protein
MLVIMIVLNRRLWDLEKDLVFLLVAPVVLVWSVFFVYFVFIFLPISAFSSLYSYLRGREIPSSHSMLISAFTLIGVLGTFVFLVRL